MPSRFSRSVETRRRYDWLRMMFPGARLFRAPIWCTSGGMAARERQGALSQRVWWCSSTGWIRTRFVEGGGQLDRRRARGVLNPCARESKARIGRFLRKKLMSDHVFFFLRGPTRSGERARFVGLFQGCTWLWTAGCWLARRLHQLKAFTTMDLGISIFLISV